jgi:hypothetical protein
MSLDSATFRGQDAPTGVRTAPMGIGWMTHRITVTSRLPAHQRADLEALLFFNARQHRMRHEIEQTIERYGLPEIVEHGGWLRVRVAGLPEVQSLYAVHEEAGRSRPVGAVIYVRDAFERFTVVHIGVADDYATGGAHSSERVLLRLVQEIRRVARRTSGIQHVELAYSQNRPREPARSAAY